LKFPAWRGRVVPEIDGPWVGYRDDLVWQCEYPVVGRFPQRHPWWKPIPFGAGNTIIVHLRLPGLLRVTNWPHLETDHYEWYVAIDEHRYRYFQFKIRRTSGLKALWLRIEYQLLWRWLADRQFNDQDKRMIEVMEPFYSDHDGWNREQLFRQDVVLTAWRKFASKNARPARTRLEEKSS
jgi:hypothetical protein